MSGVLHVATAAVVKVSLGGNGGNRVARFVQRGDLVPVGVDGEQLERLTARGLIAAVVVEEELVVDLDAERVAAEAVTQAAFDEAVKTAAKELVLAREPELEAGIQQELARLDAEREREFEARVTAAAETIAANQAPPKTGTAKPATKP